MVTFDYYYYAARKWAKDPAVYYCRRLDPSLASSLLGSFRTQIEGSAPFGRELFIFICVKLDDRYGDRRFGVDFKAEDIKELIEEIWINIRPREFVIRNTEARDPVQCGNILLVSKRNEEVRHISMISRVKSMLGLILKKTRL